MEEALRTAVLSAGTTVLGGLLEGIGCGNREQSVICHCGAIMQSKGIEEKILLTIMGPLPFRRSRYECPDCAEARYPGDEELDIVGTGRTPGLRRMMARAGSRQPFKEAKEDLKALKSAQKTLNVLLKGSAIILRSGRRLNEKHYCKLKPHCWWPKTFRCFI